MGQPVLLVLSRNFVSEAEGVFGRTMSSGQIDKTGGKTDADGQMKPISRDVFKNDRDVYLSLLSVLFFAFFFWLR